MVSSAGPVPAGGLRLSGLLPATAQSAVSTRTCTAVLPLSRMLISGSRQQQRYYARAVNDKPYSVRQDDKPRPTTKQPAAERDRGLAGLAQLEASPAVPAGRIAQMLDYALSNSGSPLIIKRVLALIKKVEGKHRNDYALLVSTLSKVKNLSDKERMSAAQTLYERMNKLHDNHSARLFDVAIFSTLIKIFAAGGDWARCEALMQHMRDEKIKPTVVTYTNLLKYCERVESWHKAAEVLEQMKTEAPGLKPDVVFYTAMVNVCCKRNDLTQALRVLAEMRNEGVKPNIFTYASLVNICEREKNLKKALDLLEEMKDENIQPNVYIYTSLINVCEKKRDLVTAMKLFDDMTRLYRIRPNTFTFNSLLNVCVEKRDLDKGMEVLALMRQHQVVPNTSTFNSLASLCAKTGNAAKGLELLATMKTTGVSPDNLTFTSLIAACRARDTEGNDAADTDDSTDDSTAAQARESAASPPLEQALSLLDRMQREFNVAPDNITLMTLMSVCLRSRRLGYALRAYGQAKAELARNRALQLDKENYYELVNLCAKNGQWRRGLEIVSDMENAGLTPSVRIYNSFLRNFDPTRDLEDAKEVVRMMRGKEVEEDDTTKVLLRRLGIQPRHIGQILQQGPSNKRANTAAETKKSSTRRDERANSQGSKHKAQPTTKNKEKEERRKSK